MHAHKINGCVQCHLLSSWVEHTVFLLVDAQDMGLEGLAVTQSDSVTGWKQTPASSVVLVPRAVDRNALQYLLPQVGCKLSWEGLALGRRGWADGEASVCDSKNPLWLRDMLALSTLGE